MKKIKKVSTSAKTKKNATKTLARKSTEVLNAENKTDEVNDFMNKSDHPLKKEVQAVRAVIMSVNKNITEQIKWAAPSFSYKGYMVTFNLFNKKRVHLVFHNGAVLGDIDGLLEGDYVDRRMAYFDNMADVKKKRPLLVKAIKRWISIMNKQL
jgi:hypothetical protein